jgi:hypothetical protein
MSILPGLEQFRGYQWEWVRGDVLAVEVYRNRPTA